MNDFLLRFFFIKTKSKTLRKKLLEKTLSMPHKSRLYNVLLGLNRSMLRTSGEYRYYPPKINTKKNQDIDSIIKEIEKIERFYRAPEYSYLFKYRDVIERKK